VRLLHHRLDVLVVAKGLLAVGEELGDVGVRSRELSRAFVCFRSRVGWARTSGNRARSGWAPPPKSVDDSLFFRAKAFASGRPILGIVDGTRAQSRSVAARAEDPPGFAGRSRRALRRTSSSSSATLTESSSASDRDTTSTLRAPPSPKWAHTSMSFFALMALGEAFTGAAFATARIRSGGI
jgi:hypothetical protein